MVKLPNDNDIPCGKPHFFKLIWFSENPIQIIEFVKRIMITVAVKTL